jgi:hypothetical protein
MCPWLKSAPDRMVTAGASSRHKPSANFNQGGVHALYQETGRADKQLSAALLFPSDYVSKFPSDYVSKFLLP